MCIIYHFAFVLLIGYLENVCLNVKYFYFLLILVWAKHHNNVLYEYLGNLKYTDSYTNLNLDAAIDC